MSRLADRHGASFCKDCGKLAWPSLESAMEQVNRQKQQPGARRSDLLDAYKCPHRDAWHVGHNYKLRCASICIGEHR